MGDIESTEKASHWVARSNGSNRRRWFLVQVAAEKGFGPRTRELDDARGRIRRWGSPEAAKLAAQRLNGVTTEEAEADFASALNRGGR